MAKNRPAPPPRDLPPLPLNEDAAAELRRVFAIVAADADKGFPALITEMADGETLLVVRLADFHAVTDGQHRAALAV